MQRYPGGNSFIFVILPTASLLYAEQVLTDNVVDINMTTLAFRLFELFPLEELAALSCPNFTKFQQPVRHHQS